MGQIVVRGIAEADMAALEARARRLGRSREQEVRDLIARAAAEERGWEEHGARSREWLERLSGRGFPDSTASVRADRDGGWGGGQSGIRARRGQRGHGERRERCLAGRPPPCSLCPLC